MTYCDIIVNLIIGLIAGTYAGIIVARISKFEELKNESKRIVWGIDFIAINDFSPKLSKRTDTAMFQIISSEMYFLKHKTAGDSINALSVAIESALRKPPEHPNDMEKYYSVWQKIIRELRPNMRSILSLNFFHV